VSVLPLAEDARLLLIRTSALGDVVHCLPVLTRLRRARPGAKIGWVIEGSLAPLLDGHPDLDSLLIVETRKWRQPARLLESVASFRRFLDQVDAFSPDVVLDLMGNHKAGFLSALTLADRRLGLERRFRREPSSALWINEGVAPRGEHAVERALSLLDALGLRSAPVDFGAEKLFPEFVLEAHTVGAARDRLVLIHPGAGWGNKRYRDEGWGEVAARLARFGLEVLITAGPGEEGLAERVVRASAGAARPFPAPSLRELVGLIRAVALVLGGDTGPVHLAHALGTRVLCLMGPTDPARSGPYDAPQSALSRLLPCSFCHRRFAETKACLQLIRPEEVVAAARTLLRSSQAEPQAEPRVEPAQTAHPTVR
jgi:heptosyltransferase-1